MQTVPTFPTTQVIDALNIPLVDLFLTPVRAIKHRPHKAVELLKLLREASPALSMSEFKTHYELSEGAVLWIEGEIAQ